MASADATVDVPSLPAWEGTRAWAWALVRGAVIGVALGVAFRAWMRLVSTAPEFTWSGTLFVVMLCTIAGVGASLSRTALERWNRAGPRGMMRVFGTVSVLSLGMGAGTLVLPIWLTAGLAWGRRDWNRWARLGLAGLSLLATVGAFVGIREDLDDLGLLRSALSVPSLLAIMAVIAVLFSWPTGPVPSVATGRPSGRSS